MDAVVNKSGLTRDSDLSEDSSKRVLLTGASGFVGSHVLEALGARAISTVLLLRPTSDRRWIQSHLPHVEVRNGSVADPASLRDAVRDVTHVIHCAGVTKALRVSEFYAVNQTGTANLVAAVNGRAGEIRRLVHMSSLAACGPGTAASPARESDQPHPVSEYGRSKLGAEREVVANCRSAFTILRPPAVYGPRDREFLRLFRSVQQGWAPAIAGGTQPLSLVYAADLAAAAVACLDHPMAAGKTYHVAAAEPVTAWQVAARIGEAMGRRPRRVPIPPWLLRLTCLAAAVGARVSRRANLLDHDKHREILAPGWVCDPSLLGTDLGFECPTLLAAGVKSTLGWYREQGWLERS